MLKEPLKICFGILENWLRDIFEQKGTEETERRLDVFSVVSVDLFEICTGND